MKHIASTETQARKIHSDSSDCFQRASQLFTQIHILKVTVTSFHMPLEGQSTMGQAETIGGKLYATWGHKKRCQDWVLINLSKEKAHQILLKIKPMNQKMQTEHNEEYGALRTWGREQLYAAGYKDHNVNKSL